MDTFFQYIFGFFDQLFSTPLQPWIPWGPGDWYFTISTTFFVVVILFLARRLRKAGSGSIADGVRRIIASTGDVSAGLSGAKKVDLKDPADALVFLKIEENAIQQALTAADYFAEKGEISESIKLKLAALYQHRLETVRQAISSDEQLKSIVATSDEIGKARSDYLRKLAAMSGTAVEAEDDAGPPTVGMPTTTPSVAPPTQVPEAAPPSAGPPSGPPSGPPAGGPPAGGPPSGGPPSGGPPSGIAPTAGPPGGAAPAAGPPGGAAPAVTPPSDAAPTATPPSGPPGGAAPGGAPPGGAAPSADAPATGGKSSLQSEMLREMERLKALMGGD